MAEPDETFASDNHDADDVLDQYQHHYDVIPSDPNLNNLDRPHQPRFFNSPNEYEGYAAIRSGLPVPNNFARGDLIDIDQANPPGSFEENIAEIRGSVETSQNPLPYISNDPRPDPLYTHSDVNWEIPTHEEAGKVYNLDVTEQSEKRASSGNPDIADYYPPKQGMNAAGHILESSDAFHASYTNLSTVVMNAQIPVPPIAPGSTYRRFHNNRSELDNVEDPRKYLSDPKFGTVSNFITAQNGAYDQYPEGELFSNSGNESMEVDQSNVYSRQGYVLQQDLINRFGDNYSSCPTAPANVSDLKMYTTGVNRAYSQYPEVEPFNSSGYKQIPMEIDKQNVHQREGNMQNRQGYVQQQGPFGLYHAKSIGGKQYSNCKTRHNPYNLARSPQNPVTLYQHEYRPCPISYRSPSTSQASNSCSTTSPVLAFEEHEQSEQTFGADASTADFQAPETSKKRTRQKKAEREQMTDKEIETRERAQGSENSRNFLKRKKDGIAKLENVDNILEEYFDALKNNSNADIAIWNLRRSLSLNYPTYQEHNGANSFGKFLDFIKTDIFTDSRPKNRRMSKIESDEIEIKRLWTALQAVRTKFAECERNDETNPSTKSRTKDDLHLAELRHTVVLKIEKIKDGTPSKQFEPS